MEKMMHNHLKYLKNILLILVTLTIGCSTLPEAIKPASEKQTCSQAHEIYIINHGWHAGLAIKATDLDAAIPELSIRFPDSLYYEIGWGDAGFYQSNKVTTGLSLQAMFWSSGSVLHIVGLKTSPFERFKKSKITLLTSDEKNYQHLIAFISSSFKRGQNDEIIPESPGLYGDSQFYTGIGKYHMLNTCNKWTAKALYSAGYTISPMFKLTASSVMDSLDNACPD